MERLTYDFTIGGNHCWQVKGADNLECRQVCEEQEENGCKGCPIALAFDRLAAYEDTGLTPEEVQQMRWISVEERLPGDSDGAVLLTNEKTVIIGYRNQLFGLDGQYEIFAPAIKKGGGYMQVTHWMPLPKLPKEEPNGKK